MALQMSYTKTLTYVCETLDQLTLVKNLSKDTSKTEDIVFPQAYIVVETGNYNKTTGSINADITTYDNIGKKNVIDNTSILVTVDVSDTAKNFVSQTYSYMLTLDKYKGAISV